MLAEYARLAKTIPGPPRAFITIPKSTECNHDLQDDLLNKDTLVIFIIEEPMKKTISSMGSKWAIRFNLKPTSAK